MRLRLPHTKPLSSRGVVMVAVAVAVLVGFLGVAPVRSQTLQVEALRAEGPVPITDPWDSSWDRVPAQDVPLSAQNIAPPFGGGTVGAVTVRTLHDGSKLYVSLEWADSAPQDSVAGQQEFSDAAAVQFPVVTEAATPYTMGGPDTPVNIWQWKAVWQADIESGFATGATRYPNTYVDDYQEADDPVYMPAEQVGNLLAQRDRSTPVENLVAAGFGSLSPAPTQDVDGVGAWRDGRWRAIFARQLTPADAELAHFVVGESTMVAFAVWDGGAGDRNGQKSIAQFIELTLVDQAAPPVAPQPGDGAGSLLVFLLGAAIVMAFVFALATMGGRTEPVSVRVKEIVPEETGESGPDR